MFCFPSKFYARLAPALTLIGILAIPGPGQSKAWTDLGLGTPGQFGIPTLEATTPRYGRSLVLHLDQASQSSQVFFVLGLSRIDTPVLGGLLVPNPDAWIGAVTHAITGEATVAFDLPNVCGLQFDLYIQALVADPQAPSGVAFSQALTARIGDDVYSDINGDGYADLVVGSPNEVVTGASDAGSIHVVFGSGGRLQAAGAQHILQGSALASGAVQGVPEDDDAFGSAIGVGDFNGDGFYDVAVGVPGQTITSGGVARIQAGAVQVLYGGPNGLRGDNDQLFRQGAAGVQDTPENFDWFGKALAVGDFNGDGCDDLAIGAPYEDAPENGITVVNSGLVQVLFGSSNGLSGAGNLRITEPGNMETDDRFGWSLAAGDFDRDTLDDLAVGRPYDDFGNLQDAGAVSVLSEYTAAGGFTTTQGISQSTSIGGQNVNGVSEALDLFGFSLTAGDFDADGADDLAIGVPFEDINSNSVSAAGTVNVLYGSVSGLTTIGQQLWNQDSAGVPGVAQLSDYFGYSLTAGDFDGDCVTDLAIGIPRDAVALLGRPGSVQILFGATNSGLAASATLLEGEADDDQAGWSVSAADFDGDGSADLAAGAPGRDVSGRSAAGAVRVWYGPTSTPPVPFNEYWTQGPLPGVVEADDRFGAALAGSPDRRPL